MSGGYEAVADLLSEENGIDIISCATDTIAAGAIEALIAQSKKGGSGIGSEFWCKDATHFGTVWYLCHRIW